MLHRTFWHGGGDLLLFMFVLVASAQLAQLIWDEKHPLATHFYTLLRIIEAVLRQGGRACLRRFVIDLLISACRSSKEGSGKKTKEDKNKSKSPIMNRLNQLKTKDSSSGGSSSLGTADPQEARKQPSGTQQAASPKNRKGGIFDNFRNPLKSKGMGVKSPGSPPPVGGTPVNCTGRGLNTTNSSLTNVGLSRFSPWRRVCSCFGLTQLSSFFFEDAWNGSPNCNDEFWVCRMESYCRARRLVVTVSLSIRRTLCYTLDGIFQSGARLCRILPAERGSTMHNVYPFLYNAVASVYIRNRRLCHIFALLPWCSLFDCGW